MFRGLPVVEFDDALLKEIAAEMVDTPGSRGRDNPDIPAGYTYFGQFIDHDITFDKTPAFDRINDPDALVDFRTPRFDLDSVFGSGPTGSPELYDRNSPKGVKLLVGRNPDTDTDGTALERDDLPRNPQGVAIIGDPRNDENVIVSQLQLTFIRFYNKLVDREADRHPDAAGVFKEANRRVRWHYQWVVIHDFLARIAGRDLVDQLLKPDEHGDPVARLKFYKPKNNAFMPVEFSVAAYRFGHSMIRPTYTINDVVPELPIFQPKGKAGPLDDFHGFRRLPAAWTVDWRHFFKVGRQNPQPSRKIDTKLAEGLTNLHGERGDLRSLPLRNLKRGKALQLPPGRQVALAIGAKELTARELGRPNPVPLWFYILKEAEVREGGRKLGAVGARIVAETLIGLLAADPLSYLRVQPQWRPHLPAAKAGDFTMTDLVKFATS
jgi:heme peroxidase